MNDKNIMQRSIWWKIYFVLLTGLYILGITSSLISGEAEIIDFIEIPISIAFTIGLYGYVFSKKFGCM